MINNRKIDDLHPVVQELCNKHIAACKARGVTLQVTNTLRDEEYQAYLYAQGRTRAGSIVTNMQLVGPHGFGLAYDVVPVVNGQAVWDNNKLWTIAGEEGKKLGLTWGGDWKSIVDKPHFEYTGGLTAAQLRAGQRPLWWEVKALDWKEIVHEVADDPRWEKAINMLVFAIKAAKAQGDIGDAGILEYLPSLIEKAHNRP
ncbi:MAG TPA: M15 family metallopeptidase [Clostridia bacterium]|nr:M15 family metallopeptidase [Clostridia bacterium]